MKFNNNFILKKVVLMSHPQIFLEIYISQFVKFKFDLKFQIRRKRMTNIKNNCILIIHKNIEKCSFCIFCFVLLLIFSVLTRGACNVDIVHFCTMFFLA